MYPEQFELLRAGDVIKSKSGTLRIIEKVSQSHITKDGRTYTIYLPKLVSSWTRGNLTAISIGDSGRFQPIKVQNEEIWKWDRDKVLKTRRQIKTQYLERKQGEILKKFKQI